MAYLYSSLKPPSTYWDKKTSLNFEDWTNKVAHSSTVYVGNLSYHTTEEQILEAFSKAGTVKRIVMGLNARNLSPCGFCFVEFYSHFNAEVCVQLMNGCLCDERQIRVDWDSGENIDNERRYGRGVRGYQWRDEFRSSFDADRGGAGGGLRPESVSAVSIASGKKRSRDEYDDHRYMDKSHHSHDKSRRYYEGQRDGPPDGYRYHKDMRRNEYYVQSHHSKRYHSSGRNHYGNSFPPPPPPFYR